MANKEIADLTAATTPLAGSETVHIVQGGNSRKATTQEIADLGGGGGGAVATTYEQISASYTFVDADFAGNIVKYVTGSSAVILTLPTGITNTEPCLVVNEGTGDVTFAGDGTSVVNSVDGNLKMTGQYSGASVHRRVTNTFTLIGDLSA